MDFRVGDGEVVYITWSCMVSQDSCFTLDTQPQQMDINPVTDFAIKGNESNNI
jgi:hypothetical protein